MADKRVVLNTQLTTSCSRFCDKVLYNCIVYRLDDDHGNKNLDCPGDDVFVSLDAFDMLTDFQELDILEHATQHASSMYLIMISTRWSIEKLIFYINF